MSGLSRAVACGGLAAMVVVCGSGAGMAKSSVTVAVSAIVTGHDQRVGFRALIMKQAIAYNLAGMAKNEADGIVAFTLQGEGKRIDAAIETIRAGTRKSSDIEVKTTPAAVDPGLATFTVVDWTSTSRNITTPYTLVFRLRDIDDIIPASAAKTVWHQILATTVQGDDLKKLGGNE